LHVQKQDEPLMRSSVRYRCGLFVDSYGNVRRGAYGKTDVIGGEGGAVIIGRITGFLNFVHGPEL
jgi:hypothetical protein